LGKQLTDTREECGGWEVEQAQLLWVALGVEVDGWIRWWDVGRRVEIDAGEIPA
jgi:hypothetical protein